MLPVPFVIGIPRSGTTIMRLMLDAHPALAIPAETYFMKEFYGNQNISAEHFLYHLREHSFWVDFDFNSPAFISRLNNISPFNVSDGIREFHKAYAESYGKSRWGHKSPDYYKDIELIEQLLPEAYFIHMIRDGRDVALSQRAASGHLVMDCVRVWTHELFEFFESGFTPQHYLEVRFDDLIFNQIDTLHKICEFIELEFTSSMLYSHKYAKARMENIPPEKATWFDLTSHKPDI
jgi:hypothetical protein